VLEDGALATHAMFTQGSRSPDIHDIWMLESPRTTNQSPSRISQLRQPTTGNSGLYLYYVNCEEVTLLYLQKAKGQGFLTLLRHFMHEDTSSIPTTVEYWLDYFKNRKVNRNRMD